MLDLSSKYRIKKGNLIIYDGIEENPIVNTVISQSESGLLNAGSHATAVQFI